MIFEVISKYHELAKLDEHHRFKSWEHCYQFFSSNYKNIQDEKTFDQGCLHLAFYLASWGMLRGGSFLLQKDYRIHEYFLHDVVKNPQYHKYYLPEFQMDMNKFSVQGIDTLIHDTVHAYQNNINQINGKDQSVHVTDTLASKILLGVYGNVPAYDRYLVEALKLHGIKSQFNEQSLLEIVEFYHLYQEEFEKCQHLFSEDGIHYTPMKLVDMYFWQVGFLMDATDEQSEELIAIKEFAVNYVNFKKSQKKGSKIINVQTSTKNVGLTDKIREYIILKLNLAKVEGHVSVDLKSGDIHKSLSLSNRMPSVCNAMISLGVFSYEIIHDTPSGASSTRVVRYFLT